MKLTPPQLLPAHQETTISFSKLSREIVMDIFERIGGRERLASVAEEDPKWFYDKGFFRLTAPEKTEVRAELSVAELLLQLDNKRYEENVIDITPSRETVEQKPSDPDA